MGCLLGSRRSAASTSSPNIVGSVGSIGSAGKSGAVGKVDTYTDVDIISLAIVYNILVSTVGSLNNLPILATSMMAFTATDNFLIAEFEDPRESSRPINVAKDSPSCTSVKFDEDVLGSA